MASLVQGITNLLPSSAVSYPEDRTSTVGQYFAGAIGANTLLTQAQKELAELGFQKHNSIRVPWLNPLGYLNRLNPCVPAALHRDLSSTSYYNI